jgi:hypothetical protein
MKLTRLGRRFSQGMDHLLSLRSLVRTRLSLQLMPTVRWHHLPKLRRSALVLELDIPFSDPFRGTTPLSRIAHGARVLYLGALAVYLVRGGWHQWPPPWPVKTIASWLGILGAGAVTGGLTHYFTDGLRAAKGSLIQPVGSVLPLVVCVGTIGLGLLWLLP